jgi:hypothetical protein
MKFEGFSRKAFEKFPLSLQSVKNDGYFPEGCVQLWPYLKSGIFQTCRENQDFLCPATSKIAALILQCGEIL